MDEVFLQKVKNGDTKAFSYFVRTYKEQALAVAFSVLKNTFDAEDALQEAFIKAYKSIHSFKGRAKFSTWLYRIVVNEAYKKVNTRQKHQYTDISDSEIELIQKETALLEKEERNYYIELCFEKISPDFALVLQLHYIKEYSLKEIEGITAWSASKVKVSLHRARKSFYAELKKLLKTEVNTLQYSKN